MGAVLVPGEVAPIVVTVDMVQKMRPGSVILDFSFDQGGCVETTRLQGPTGGVFVREGVLHFAVPNCPSYVARTSSHAMTYALLPFLKSMQSKGLKETIRCMAAPPAGMLRLRRPPREPAHHQRTRRPEEAPGGGMSHAWIDDYKAKLCSADEAVTAHQVRRTASG